MRRIEREKLKRAALVWLAGLVVFAWPRKTGLLSYFESVGPWWLFLIFAPLVIAACSLLIPVNFGQEDPSQPQLWQSMVPLSILAALVLGGLVYANAVGRTLPTADPGFVHRCNVAGSVALAILGSVGIFLVWRSRRRSE